MRFSEILKSSLATLRMNGRRTFLTMFGIIIGIGAVITIMSLGNGFEQETLDSLVKDDQGRRSQEFYFNMSVIDEDPANLDPFSKDNVAYISGLPGVDEVKLSGEEITNEYMGIRHKQIEEYYDVKIVDSSQQKMLFGRNLNIADSKARMPYVIIDEMIAMTLFGNPEKGLHQAISIDHHDYTIVGIYSMEMPTEAPMGPYYMGPSQLSIPKGTYQRYSLASSFNYGMTIYYREDANMKQINKEIGQYLTDNGKEKDNGEYTYYDITESMDQIAQQLRMITLFITSIAGISLFIAGVGVMNMMYISVSERTKEIGIRRSLGATKRSIQWQFLLEGIAITSIGGLIGYGLGFVLAKVISQFISFEAIFDIPTALIAAMVSILIGIAASVFPARQASRKNVIEILR